MKLDLLIAELERDECRDGKPELMPYPDSKGKITIGIGRNLTDCGISRGEAYHLLNNDLEGVFADLTHRLSWWEGLDEVRQRVLANMCFNMGIGRLMLFVKFLAALKAGDYVTAAMEMLDSKWAKEDVGARADRLSEMMKTGLTDPVRVR
jgi:lysozyme